MLSTLMIFDTQAIFAALERKGVIETACPACGESSEWALASEPAALANLNVSLDEPVGPGARVAMVVCPKCGFLRLFHLEALLA